MPTASEIIEYSFQPTLPLRGATSNSSAGPMRHLFQPTLPLRGATTPRARYRWGSSVSTHAPLAGSDAVYQYSIIFDGQFQPTLPLRGATAGCERTDSPGHCFNPRSPCGERLSG